jgi:uncharacterized protein involved in exopolysaccharide biosynthesis
MSSALAPNRRPEPMIATDELDLLDYVSALWHRRILISACMIIAAILALTVSVLPERQYEAAALVSVSPSKVPDGNRPVSPASVVPLIESQTVVETLVREFKLNEPPENLTPEGLLQRLSGRPMADTNLIRVTMRLSEPALAARVANRSAEIALDLFRRINAQELGTLEDDLKGMLTEAETRARVAQGAYETYRRDAQHELLKGDVETVLEQRSDYLKLLVEIEAERAKLARAEQELAKRTPLGTMTQSIDKSSTMMEAARTATNSTGSVLGLQMRSDYVNDVFMKLAKLNRLYVTETVLERLKDDVEIARKAYQSVAERYQGAKLAATALTPRVQVVVPATPPERPVSRMLARNVVLGAALGFIAGAFVALVRFALQSVTEQNRHARRLSAT